MIVRGFGALLVFAACISGQPRDEHRPAFAPSEEVHISPAAGGNDGGNFGAPDYRSFQNFPIKDLIGTLYDVDSNRIDLPPSIDGNLRYDVALVLSKPESKEQVFERIRRGIADHFHVSMVRQRRMVDAYIVSAPEGIRVPAIPPPPSDSSVAIRRSSRSSTVQFESQRTLEEVRKQEMQKSPRMRPALGDIRGVATQGTIAEFCRMMEESLDRPVVNETGVAGEFEIHVEKGGSGVNDFLDRLRDQTGLVIAPERREIELVVLTPR